MSIGSFIYYKHTYEESVIYDASSDIIQIFINNEAERDISYNEIVNIILCISQGFLTIFAGEPGTGRDCADDLPDVFGWIFFL